MNRKLFLSFLSGLSLLLFAQRPVDRVYPLLDAAHSRWFYFSSACRPFGMVSLFPDNRTDQDWDSGYRYEVDSILDFSHVHEWQLAGVAVMPVSFDMSNKTTIFHDYSSRFLHSKEIVRPGYHSVFLERYNIHAELTATNRVGLHRYTFQNAKQQGVIFDLGKHLGPSDISEGGFLKVNDYEIRGYVVNAPTFRRSHSATVYFCAVFNRPVKDIALQADTMLHNGVDKWRGQRGRILVTFANKPSDSLLMKVGISYTSEEGAAKNMSMEAPGWNFERVRQDAESHWNDLLSRIQIEGGTKHQQQRFYTDLWHAIQGRRIISDADGKYTDCTGLQPKVRQLPLDAVGNPKFSMYNSDAFWGAQWTLNTLWQLVYPEVAEEFCNSFVEYYKNGGLIPRGPSGGNYTYVMTGASSTPFFVAAWQKGIRRFDIEAAYAGLKKNHQTGGMMSKAGYEHQTSKGGGLEFYMAHGYVPYPLSDTIYGMHQDGGAITLENAYQDWCLAQLATSLGKTEDAAYFTRRSENYRNIYNPKERFMVPRDKNGHWQHPFDPLIANKGFEEGNSAQYTWFVPHDLPGLFSLMGGADTAVVRLNKQFEISRWHRFCNEHPEMVQPGVEEFGSTKAPSAARKFIDEQRTWTNYSNQPGTQMAGIFNYAGAPWLTQYWSRAVVDSAYSKLSPYYGYNGDEDQGMMGSLSVLMKLGLFQMTGGCDANPKYELGSPLFPKVTITLNPDYYKARQLTIETVHNDSRSPYIQSVLLNGRPLKTYYFRHSDIVNGAHLVIDMGSQPNKNWGKE